MMSAVSRWLDRRRPVISCTDAWRIMHLAGSRASYIVGLVLKCNDYLFDITVYKLILQSTLVFTVSIFRPASPRWRSPLYSAVREAADTTRLIKAQKTLTRKRAFAKALHLEGRTTSRQTFWVFQIWLVWKYSFRTFCEVRMATATWRHAHQAYLSTPSRGK